MRHLALTLFALACTPDGGPGEPWYGEDDGTPMLYEGADFPERARLYDDPGPARLTVDGPDLIGERDTGEWVGTVVVVDPGDQVRIRWNTAGVELLLWLDRADLADVTAVHARATATSEGGDGWGSVTVPPGIEVDLNDAHGERVHVSWTASHHAPVRLSGWVDLADIDQVWDVSSPGPQRQPWQGVLVGAILDQPHGDVLAEPLEDIGMGVALVGPPEDGWQRVSWSDGHSRVEGWAFEDDIDQRLGLGIGGSGRSYCGGAGFFRTGGGDVVPANTLLRTERGGPVVARSTRPLVVPGAYEGATLDVDTPWGTATLYVDPDDMPLPDEP